MRRLIALTAVLASCTGTPDRRVDAALSDGGAADAATPVTMLIDRPFGPEGEVPVHLLAAGGDQVVLSTPAAVYRIDRAGRVLSRLSLPVASSGTVAALTSAAWDGVGLGQIVRWGADIKTPAGTYFALTDKDGAFTAASMLSLGPASTAARTTWDQGSQRHLVITAEPKGTLLDLQLTRVSRAKGQTPKKELLQAGLSSSVTLGDWVGPAGRMALCTVEQGRALLRTFAQETGPKAVDVTDPDRSALGSCHLATSGRSFLVTWVHRALPVTELDFGPSGPPSDLGPGSLSFNVPVVQVVDPDGKLALSRSMRLSDYLGTVTPESVIWDGRRYVILARTTFRGGRLELTVLDETGLPQLRQLELPLAYEPGRLLGARMALGPTGDYWLVYSLRRPDDAGVLYLARFTLD